jgi:NNP family nitrate/nitrite transporter-like MFS transporter
VLVGLTFGWFCNIGDFHGKAPSLKIFRIFLVEPAFWVIIMLLFGLGIGANQGVYNMLPLYLVTDLGIEHSRANTLLALSRISGLGMVLVAGWASDRLGSTRTLKYALLVIGMLTILLGTVQGPWLVLFIFLQPMLAACFWPAGFATLSSKSPSEVRNVAVSFTIPVAYLVGAGAIPTCIGALGEAGYFPQGIALIGALILAGGMLLQYLKFPEGRFCQS